MEMRRVNAGLTRSSRGAFAVSFVVHAIVLAAFGVYLVVRYVPYPVDTALAIEWIELPQSQIRKIFPRKEFLPVEKMALVENTFAPRMQATPSPNLIPEVVRRSPALVTQSVELNAHRLSTVLPQATSLANLTDSRVRSSVSVPVGTAPGSTSGRGVETGRVRAAAGDSQGQGLSIVRSTGAESGLSISQPKFADATTLLRDDQLGAVLQGKGNDITGHIRIVRVKHSLSDWWQDPTAMASLIEFLEEHTRIRADMKFEGGALGLTDDRILDAPMLIMTGHDKDITVSRNMARGGPLTEGLSDAERMGLRKYLLDRQGTLFFDDCGFNGLFAEQVRQELRKVLPEYDLQDIPHNHEVYTIFYELSGPPQGGDVFWNSENNPKMSAFKFHKGIVLNGRLAVLYNRKDYMCAMETAEIESRTMLRLRRSPTVYRFMTNLIVYALKHGGNVDRSRYASR
jgi:hypothetical protein